MNRLTTIRTVRSFFLVTLFFSLAFGVACKKEEQPRKAPETGQAYNPYSNTSVFDEVKKKLEKNPNDVDELYHLAGLYDDNGQYPEAVDTYKKVVALKPDMGYAYLKMGTAYDRMGKPDEAVNALRKATKYMPKNPVAYNNLGVAYGKLGKDNDEIAALKKAIQIRPSYSSARYNLGMTYMRTKNRKSAMQQYEELKKFDGGTAEALLKEINQPSGPKDTAK